jgi:hypothetical protein
VRRRCEYCGQVFPVLSKYVWNDDNNTSGVVYVRWIANPFAEDVHADRTLHWICDTCYQEESDAI